MEEVNDVVLSLSLNFSSCIFKISTEIFPHFFKFSTVLKRACALLFSTLISSLFAPCTLSKKMTTTSSTSTTPSTSTPTFSFSSFPRVHPVDWNLLERVPSPEDIVRLHDVDGLELIVEDIIRGDFSSSSSSFLPPLPRDENDNNGDDDDDENKKKAKLKEKAFRLAQLLVEYLLFVQDVLVERKTASQIENDKLKTELEVWVRRAKEEREKRKALQNTTRANKKEDEKEEKEEEEAGVVVEELKGKLKETMDALERARAELEEFKRQQKAAVAGGNEDERGNRKSGKENSVEANGGKNNGSNAAAAAAAAGGVDKTQYSGKLRQEVKNLLVRVGAKSAGKLSDRNTARSFGKLQKIIESESNSSDRSAAERRKYQETSRTLHLTLVNGESFQVI